MKSRSHESSISLISHHLSLISVLWLLPDCSFSSRIGMQDNMLIQHLGSLFYMLIILPFHMISSLFERLRQKFTSTNMNPSPPISSKGPRIKQPFEVFLVLDIEGTCDLGTDFNYPNEIIVRARITS